MTRRRALVAACVVALATVSCAKQPTLDPSAGIGPNPTLPDPRYYFIAPIKASTPAGWSRNESPTPAAGLTVTRFAQGLDHPRWLYVLSNGDVLVAESDSVGEPVKRPKDIGFLLVMRATKSPPPKKHRLSLLRDADGDGVAELRTTFLDNLHSPFGMALVGSALCRPTPTC